MGPDRFDDVEYRVLEQPDPPRWPRVRRWTLTALSAVLATGMLAGGASALSGDDRSPASAPQGEGWEYYAPLGGHKGRDGRDCDKGKRHQRRSSAVRY